MDLEECIRFYEQTYGLPRGQTCENHRGTRVRFQPCECSRRDASYQGPGDAGYFDFIGRGPRGGIVYVGAFREITVGPKGYHYGRAGSECV